MNENKKKKIFISVGISLAFHAVFLIAALNVVVAQLSKPPEEAVTMVHVKIDTRRLASRPEGDAMEKTNYEPRVETPELGPPQFATIESGPDTVDQNPSVAMAGESQEVIVSLKSKAEVVLENAPLETKSKPVTKRVPVSRTIASENVLKEFVPTAAESLKDSPDLAKSFAQGADDADTGLLSMSTVISSEDNRLQGVPKQNMQIPFETRVKTQDIKSFLGYELLTFEDPTDHARYFKLSVRVEETPVTLPSIPKEIIFLIDASNSIGAERLDQFKAGVAECLTKLGMNDKFNVMVFKKTVAKFMPKSILRDPSILNSAAEFLSNFKTGSKTDVYDAVLKSIDIPEAMKPTYILLLSDGQATEGVTNPQQIINQMATINKGRIPVFAFGGGVFVDEYLLEFLAFTNRGWAEFSPKSFQVAKRLVTMYSHIKDPVLLNLRYYVSGLSEKEIYPKLLPDFFRGSQFVLYGRYTDEKAFFLKLLGDAQGEVKEYLITNDISQAPKGTRDIAVQWAFRKVYHLVSKLEHDKDNTVLLQEIKDLSKKFELRTPYIDK
ncbi:MAG: VWA domain-containing protein [Candidatus Omnitrophica bacterium]|nr:VWA domain-containing protein [Candidatus Omnitrophota bacterium]